MGPAVVLERGRPAAAGTGRNLVVVEEGRWVPPPPVAQRERWPWLLAGLAWVAYVLVAWWLIYVQHFELNDALSKTAAAHHVISSRDPHLGAIGFYWMPLPQFVQVPFVYVASLVGQARFAGPLVTSLWGAVTVPVVAAVGRTCRVATRVRVAMTALYAFSPIAIFASANGMSEASSLFFLALTALGYARWDRFRSTGGLALMALGLSGVMACRYEGFAVALAMAAICAAQVPRERWGRTIAFVLAPTFSVFALWLIVSRLIVGDALFWYHLQVSLGTIGSTLVPPVLGVGYGTRAILPFLSMMIALFAGPILLVLPFSVVRPLRRSLGLLGHWTPALSFVLIVLLQLVTHTTAAAPRYFYPCWLLSVTAAFAVVGERGAARRHVRWRTWFPRYVLLVVVVAVALQTVGFLNPRVAAAEKEGIVFASVIGRHAPQAPPGGWDQAAGPWKAFFATVDPMLAKGDLLMLDTESAPQAPLFTRHPRRLMIPEDRDFEQALAAPAGVVDLIAVPTGRLSELMGRSKYLPTMKATVASASAVGRWDLVDTIAGIELHRWVATTPSAPNRGAGGQTTPPSTSPGDTVPAAPSTTVAPPTTAPAKAVLGPGASRTALLTGAYPTGQPWPTVRLEGSSFVARGTVPSPALAAAIIDRARTLLGAATVEDRLVVDRAIPDPVSFAVLLNDAPAFDAAGAITPAGEAAIALWVARLQAQPDARLQIVLSRIDARDATADTRAGTVFDLLVTIDPVAVERVTIVLGAAPGVPPIVAAVPLDPAG